KWQRRRGVDRIDRLQRCDLMAPGLPCVLTSCLEERRIDLGRAELVSAITRLHRRTARRLLAGKCNRLGLQIAIDDAIDEAGGERVGCRDQATRYAHVNRALDTDESRETLCALGAGNDPQ